MRRTRRNEAGLSTAIRFELFNIGLAKNGCFPVERLLPVIELVERIALAGISLAGIRCLKLALERMHINLPTCDERTAVERG